MASVIRIGNSEDGKFSQISEVSSALVGHNGELTIEHHTNRVTCYASGFWRWYFWYDEDSNEENP